jgi:nucleotide sugar dehydrogenase
MENYAVIYENESLQKAIEHINEVSRSGGEPGIGIIVDEYKEVKGVITDGDFRNLICRSVSFEERVGAHISSEFFHVFDDMSSREMLDEIFSNFKSPISGKDPRLSKVIVLNKDKKFKGITNVFDLYKSDDISLKTVSVYGLGYVGLTLALTFAEAGVDTVGVDINEELCNQLSLGRPHFFERGLDSLLEACLSEKKIRFQPTSKAKASDIYVISVGTPVNEGGEVIYSYLEKAATDISKVLKEGNLIILRSTVPVGTSRKKVVGILEEGSGLVAGVDFHLAFAPERTVEGNALNELKTLPQIIGGLTKKCSSLAGRVFSTFNSTIVNVDTLEAAEIIKLINNTYRDTVFSFANDIAALCDDYNVNAFNVIRAANEGYPRNPIPLPSPGVGGICLVKDPFLYQASFKKPKDHFGKFSRTINSNVVDRIYSNFKQKKEKIGLKDKTVMVVGLAFKGDPETSDMRFSPSIDLIDRLVADNFKVLAWDKVVLKENIDQIPGVEYCDLLSGIKEAGSVFFMNNHKSNNQFNSHHVFKESCEEANSVKIVFDGWSLFRQKELESIKNLHYMTLGYCTSKEV